jgi:hypothetical protein
MTANVWLVAGGQIKTYALSTVIKIIKELQTSMTHSPARLPQAIVRHSYFFTTVNENLSVVIGRTFNSYSELYLVFSMSRYSISNLILG